MRMIKERLIMTCYLVFIICVAFMASCNSDISKRKAGTAGWKDSGYGMNITIMTVKS